MNSLIALWQIVTGLAQSLSRTKELIDTANERMERSLGLSEPMLTTETKQIEETKPRRKQ